MAYNFDKNTCDKCGISKEDIKTSTFKSYQDKMLTESFRLGQDGSVLCPDCHKENQLKSILG